MPRFDSILFDFDGVLLDSEPVHWACWREVLLPLGVSLEWDFYRERCIGIDDRLMLQMMADGRDWRELWERYPAKKELFQQRMIAAPPFPEGLPGLLEELRGSYRMAIVSSSGRSEIEPLVERAGLRGYFDTIVGGGDVEHHKPAPEPYLLAASRLGVSAPLVLEDSEAGIASGRAAGFTVARVGHPSELERVLRTALAMPATP
ncbi:MAG TPA: HAD family phosphatase [Bryobacteraceae bacterium]|jgi:HAD superfamily hydrolase (TIGR01509 family)|nr:HAD family phosphatase [Bryobacteraceae bacterium]